MVLVRLVTATVNSQTERKSITRGEKARKLKSGCLGAHASCPLGFSEHKTACKSRALLECVTAPRHVMTRLLGSCTHALPPQCGVVSLSSEAALSQRAAFIPRLKAGDFGSRTLKRSFRILDRDTSRCVGEGWLRPPRRAAWIALASIAQALSEVRHPLFET
jgi:hypothetical protein